MSRKQPAFVGIDIGAYRCKCVIGIEQTDGASVQIVGLGTAQNAGIRRGTVVDVNEVSEALNKAIEEAERTAGYTIDAATVGINGVHIESQTSRGVIAVTGGNRTIDASDVSRAEEAATVVQVPQNREILHIFPRAYALDGQADIQDPIGMSGVRLEVEALLVTAASPAIKNLQRCLEQAQIRVNQQFVNSVAAAHVVLTKAQRETGAAVLDIGHSTTNLAVYEEGEILHVAVLPLGSMHITNDIAIGLKTDLSTAEQIKNNLGDIINTNQLTITVQANQPQERSYKTQRVVDIVEARVEEIFEHANQQLQYINRRGKLPGGVVLCGGGAMMPNIEDLARNFLELPAQIGAPKDYEGIIDHLGRPDMVTAVGLLELDRLSADTPSLLSGHIKSGRNWWNRWFERLKP